MPDDSSVPSSVDLDLDALAPVQVKINYKDRTITVNPLDLVKFSKLFNLSAEMGKVDEVKDPARVMEIYAKVEALIKEAIPELQDETLNNLQLTALFNLLAKLNTPTDKALRELEARGISLNKGGDSDPKDLTS